MSRGGVVSPVWIAALCGAAFIGAPAGFTVAGRLYRAATRAQIGDAYARGRQAAFAEMARARTPPTARTQSEGARLLAEIEDAVELARHAESRGARP